MPLKPKAKWLVPSAVVAAAALWFSIPRDPAAVKGGAIAGTLARQIDSADIKSQLRAEIVLPSLNGGKIVLASPYRTAKEAQDALGLSASDARYLEEATNIGPENALIMVLDRNRRIREFDWPQKSTRVSGRIESGVEGQVIEVSTDENGRNRTVRILPPKN